MKRFRLPDLDLKDKSSIIDSIVPGKQLSKGGLSFRKPGERTHDEACSCPSCDGQGRHMHKEDFEAFVLLQGKAAMEIDCARHAMELGDIILCEPGEDHHLVAGGESTCVNLWLHISSPKRDE